MAESHAIQEEKGHAHDGEAQHVGWKKYVIIGVILAVITGVEVAILEVESLESVLIPVLLILSAAKFFLVVQYYMHLKMDHPIFGRVFWAPLFLAVLVIIGMVILFKILPKYGVFS
jgi:cytochrome c oxidase subunit IV